jgi:hypothetical protein
MQAIGVEPNKVKRSGVGLRAYDPARAFDGFTLFTPSAGGKTVYLIDMVGNVAHTWEMPHPPGYAYLTDRGTLFYNGKVPTDTFLGRAPYGRGAALEVDWNGRVLWEVRHPEHSHDGIRLRNGNVLLICATAIPPELASRVRGADPAASTTARSTRTTWWR